MTAFFHDHALLAEFLLFGVLTAALVGSTLLGLRIGRRIHAEKDSEPSGLGAVETAVYGLFGLLLAFAFSGAAERFQARKTLMLEEAQAAGTAASRLDLFPDPVRGGLKKLLKAYLDRRVAAYAESNDRAGLEKAVRESEELGARLQSAAVAACATESGRGFANVVVPAVNDLLDIGLARRVAMYNHPPPVIFGLLFLLALLSAATSGSAMGASRRLSGYHIALFAVVLSAVMTLIVDLEFPRLGTIRVSGQDALLKEVADSLR